MADAQLAHCSEMVENAIIGCSVSGALPYRADAAS